MINYLEPSKHTSGEFEPHTEASLTLVNNDAPTTYDGTPPGVPLIELTSQDCAVKRTGSVGTKVSLNFQ